MNIFKWFKRDKDTTINDKFNDLQVKTYNLEQGLYSAQKQLNQLYRVLWDYSHIVITHNEEEKNALIQAGFVIVGQNVFQCFDYSSKRFDVFQREYYILKLRKE